jgi:hypothetical protein
LTADQVVKLVEEELRRVRDVEAEMRLRSLLVRPHAVLRDWDQGRPGEQLECWTVAEHADSNTGVAYCEHLQNRWGVVDLSAPGVGKSWFRSLEAAVRNSQAWANAP